jgi:hypothetical protein
MARDPRGSAANPKKTRSRNRPHGNDQADWRSRAKRSPSRDGVDDGCQRAIAAFMAMHRRRDDGGAA